MDIVVIGLLGFMSGLLYNISRKLYDIRIYLKQIADSQLLQEH